jgi:mRNA interferase MazF
MVFHSSTTYLRGEVYLVDLNPTKGSEINKQRPCIVVGANPINRARSTIVVIPLSSSPSPRPPLVVPITSMGTNSVAVCDQIRAIDKSRILKKIGELTPLEMNKLDDSMQQVLAL